MGPKSVLHPMVLSITSQFSPGPSSFHAVSLPWPPPFNITAPPLLSSTVSASRQGSPVTLIAYVATPSSLLPKGSCSPSLYSRPLLCPGLPLFRLGFPSKDPHLLCSNPLLFLQEASLVSCLTPSQFQGFWDHLAS